MELAMSSSVSSGSFDGAMFARYLLEPDLEGCTPPRITRFSFEDDYARDHLTASLSGQFSSYYGLPYDSSPPPEENSQDTASEHSSRGPITPPASGHLPLPLDSSSQLSTSYKPDDPFTQDSTSLFLDSRSLLPGQSLLNDTPSYLGLVSARSEDISLRPSHTRPQTMPLPAHIPVPLRQPMPLVEERPRLPASNRGVTVRQLALELPMSRARSGSLSTLIHALEDASPGWYESLMDSALPQPASPLSLPAAKAPQPPLRRWNEARHPSAPLEGLPKDMLADLAELEALAVAIGRLPIPRPRTMALELAATAFSSGAAPSLDLSQHVSLRSPPSTPPQEERERQLTVRFAPTASTRERGQSVNTRSSSSEQYGHSCASPDEDQPAFTNGTHHQKPINTLGMRSSLPATSRLLAPAPKTPSWRAGRRSAIPRMSTQTTTRTYPPPLPREDMDPPRKAPQTPHKTAKPLNLHSLFRRRPSAPPMPMQPPELGGSPVRSTAKRAAHLSAPIMRPLHPPSGDSPTGKSFKYYGATSAVPCSLPPLSPLGSFLPM
ncbi:hypothetical protein OH76DRAFT_190188 [Lentinus brumalis]|uniref:Uncharacterized protein n=1 Tax=Lentinus brumalis TaxID=2498619 RepID=A0A371CMY6_9APHY|nr:hypothetical protein OH76DRAFT_190188 [Polyporus brumalis]